MHRPGIEPGASRYCPIEWMATANFTTKPPMLEMKGVDHVIDERQMIYNIYIAGIRFL